MKFFAVAILLTISSSAYSQPSCQLSNSDPDGDGWGWENDRSCRVDNSSVNQLAGSPSSDNCDYSNASSSGGWGWDPIARQSCPPVSSGGDSQHSNGGSSSADITIDQALEVMMLGRWNCSHRWPHYNSGQLQGMEKLSKRSINPGVQKFPILSDMYLFAFTKRYRMDTGIYRRYLPGKAQKK